MKQFAFEFEGKEYHLRKLTQDIKDEVTDFMTAGRLRQIDRMAKKGLRTATEAELDRQVAFVKWGSKGYLNDLLDEENGKKFLRCIIVEPVDDATLMRLAVEQTDEDSEIHNAMRRMMEDADPKAQTPPPSEPTPTGGAASS